LTKFTIHQKASIYFEVEVEAESLSEAILLADESSEWVQTEAIEMEDEYWYSTDGYEWEEVK